MSKRGVVLAGGSGSRLRPITEAYSKAMVTAYDRPAIEYPLRSLRDMGCESAVVVAAPESIGPITNYFGEGERIELELIYRVQAEPRGVADALSKAEGLVDGVFPLLLGDVYIHPVLAPQTEPTLFWHGFDFAHEHSVWDPEDNSIIEKPPRTVGQKAIIGYYYDQRVFDHIRGMTPAESGELEIVDLHRHYQGLGAQFVEHSGFFADMGTPSGLLRAANHIASTREA